MGGASTGLEARTSTQGADILDSHSPGDSPSQPLSAVRLGPIRRRLSTPRRQPEPKKPIDIPKVPRIGQRLDQDDQRLLGETVWAHASVFTWEAGDILIVDNLQMHHAGMPGAGPRDLKVIMGNPISIEGGPAPPAGFS